MFFPEYKQSKVIIVMTMKLRYECIYFSSILECYSFVSMNHLTEVQTKYSNDCILRFS